ncbi:50S ribosomal protein L27 [Candidatus Vidania fulgoroideorum]
MAKKKAAGSLRNGRDSHAKRLGVKIFSGFVRSGVIIIRQRGSRIRAGINTYYGKDYTIHARMPGYVQWYTHKGIKHVYIL